MTQVKLYNSKKRFKELFEPIDTKNVRMYVCGPTVYDRAHLGNARPVVVFDMLYRLLRQVYGLKNVNYVRNFTDIDDKINSKSLETGEDIKSITDRTIDLYLQDMKELAALEPRSMPRATHFISQMIEMVTDLINKGHAYETDGHVLFDVDSYADYGSLSGRSIDDMIAGSRVEVAPYKRNPMDFILWKPSDVQTPGWDSPWGRGRPGWHIECSAMAHHHFGDSFDIHGGGNDLQFPHHENELAQSKCANPEGSFANVWIHNEMLQVEGKKMSKSLGNFFSVRDLLNQGIPGEVIRFVLLSTHYSKPMDWTQKKANEATATLRKWHGLVADIIPGKLDVVVLERVANDINTPGALARLHELAKNGDVAGLLAGAEFLGLLGQDSDWWRPQVVPSVIMQQIQNLVEARSVAKADRDFAKADEIRDKLSAAGIEIIDKPNGISEIIITSRLYLDQIR
jgi:cysteinyl-tRNA synthetase